MYAITIGLDIAKSVFQVHGEDANGKIVIRKQLRRAKVMEFSPSCPAAWSRWRRAARRTTGQGHCEPWATRCG